MEDTNDTLFTNQTELLTEKPVHLEDKSSSEADNKDSLINEDAILPFAKILEASVHVGLAVTHWNPRMSSYVFQKKRRYCVMNVQKISAALQNAFDYLKKVVADGGQVLFVDARNRYVQEWIRDNCSDVKNVHFVAQRWLGGTLTNFKTMNNSVEKLNSLVALKNSPDFARYTKKEQIEIEKKITKLVKFFGGIIQMKGLPDVIVLTDPITGKNTVSEAMKLGIPVVSLANTNANPELINHLIPCNTHSSRAVILILSVLLDAVKMACGQEPTVAFKKSEEITLFSLPRVEHVRKIVNHRISKRR